MSEQDGTQTPIKQRRSQQANKQDGTQVPALQRPVNDDTEAWKAYWKSQGHLWRTQPEIDLERQKFLTQRHTIVPNIEKGIYPFKNIKLNRADVEWLLATHENGRGPVFWSGDNNRMREGLDLRGADLRQGNLERLPLAFTRGGLFMEEWDSATEEQRDMAAVLLSEANLGAVHLERAVLRGAYLEGTSLSGAHLENASFREAHLCRSILTAAHLNGVALMDARLSDEKHIGPTVADTNWSNANLAYVKWSHIKMLGDEYKARQRMHDGKVKDTSTQLSEYERAVRANRQLAVALQTQGLNEVAVRFAYRAQKLQRIVFRRQRSFGQYLFFLFLDVLAGYGYKPGRSVIWYLFIIFGFAIAYFTFGHLPLLPDAFVFSLTSFHGRGFFPGLGSETSLHNPLVLIAAIEAIVGLFIEISFIATFTQRYFGK